MSGPTGYPPGCPACSRSVRLAPGEVDRLVALFFEGSPPELAEEAECARRLAICASCPDLLYGTTCRHCGCLVEVRARIAAKGCASPEPRWGGSP